MARSTYEQVMIEIDWLLRKDPKPPMIHEDMVHAVVNTKKFRGLTSRELAVIVINRARDAVNRLGHQTGAENWL